MHAITHLHLERLINFTISLIMMRKNVRFI